MPRALTFSKKTEIIQLQMKDQGVLMFEYKDITNPCKFTFRNSEKHVVLSVMFDISGVCVLHNTTSFLDPNNTQGLISVEGARYWFSVNAQNQTLYGGIGEARQELVL